MYNVVTITSVFLNFNTLYVLKNFKPENVVSKLTFDKSKDLLDSMDSSVLTSFDLMNDWSTSISIPAFLFTSGLSKPHQKHKVFTTSKCSFCFSVNWLSSKMDFRAMKRSFKSVCSISTIFIVAHLCKSSESLIKWWNFANKISSFLGLRP